MTDCRYKKRIQFYIDGWIDERGSRDIEKHLKHCPQCQVEMAELAELNGAALEIVNEAPDREYWESFNTRVRNRILSRNVEPVRIVRRAPWYLSMRLASVFVMVLAVFATTIALLRWNVRSPIPVVNITSPVSKQLNTQTPPVIVASEELKPGPSVNNNPSDIAQPDLLLAENNNNIVSANTVISTNRPQPRSTRSTKTADEIEVKDTEAFLRFASEAESQPLNLGNKPIISVSSSPAVVDPSFRMKSSFVGQQIMAGINAQTQNFSSGASQSPLYSLGPDGSAKTPGEISDIPSTWGYMRVPTDTSKSAEIMKYFLELELMQTK